MIADAVDDRPLGLLNLQFAHEEAAARRSPCFRKLETRCRIEGPPLGQPGPPRARPLPRLPSAHNQASSAHREAAFSKLLPHCKPRKHTASCSPSSNITLPPAGMLTRVSDELAIRLRGVVKRYGEITAVDHLDLDVPVGTCVGLLGPNGAGKSTTMRLLTAQAIADEGEIEVLGFRLPRGVEAGPRAMRRRAAARQPRHDAHRASRTCSSSRTSTGSPAPTGTRRSSARWRWRTSSTAATRASTSSPAGCAGAC